MKSRYAGLLALPLMLLLQACPVGTDYPLGYPGKEKADPGLIGTWEATDASPEVLRASVVPKDAYSYTVEVLAQSDLYMIGSTRFTGYTTILDKQNFFYVFDRGDSKYYLYHYRLKGKKELDLYDVGFLEKGIDGIVSTEAFRQEVTASMAREDGCFSERKTYKKQR